MKKILSLLCCVGSCLGADYWNQNRYVFELRNGSSYTVHVDLYVADADTNNAGIFTGVSAEPGQTVVTGFPSAAGSYNLRLWQKTAGVWGNMQNLGSWDYFGLNQEGAERGEIDILDSSTGPVFGFLHVERSPYWAWSQGWTLGIMLFGAGLGLVIVRKIRGGPSEL